MVQERGARNFIAAKPGLEPPIGILASFLGASAFRPSGRAEVQFEICYTPDARQALLQNDLGAIFGMRIKGAVESGSGLMFKIPLERRERVKGRIKQALKGKHFARVQEPERWQHRTRFTQYQLVTETGSLSSADVNLGTLYATHAWSKTFGARFCFGRYCSPERG